MFIDYPTTGVVISELKCRIDAAGQITCKPWKISKLDRFFAFLGGRPWLNCLICGKEFRESEMKGYIFEKYAIIPWEVFSDKGICKYCCENLVREAFSAIKKKEKF
jgi:DNA-directed RNA polymerase subunit N (RpoN/RPB10)